MIGVKKGGTAGKIVLPSLLGREVLNFEVWGVEV